MSRRASADAIAEPVVSEEPRVLLVAPLPPPPLLGGIEVGVALLLSTPLSQRVSMQLFNTARPKDASRPLREKLGYQLSMCWSFLRDTIRLRPSVVHVKAASHLNYFQNALYVLIARLLGRRVALQLHAGDFPEFYDGAGRLGQVFIRFSLRASDTLLALSPGWATYFRRLSGHETVVVVPNAVAVADYVNARPDATGFGIPAERVSVLFVGTRDPAFDVAKGLPEMLEAVARVRATQPELFLVLAGGAFDRAAIARALGPEGEAWCCVGRVAGERKCALFRSVDAFALPSHFENMPNTVIEAMAAGLPVIATAVGAVPEMLDDGVSGLLMPVRDVSVLAEHLARLVRDPGLRGRLGAQARRVAGERYDVPVMERSLLAEYHRLAAGTPIAAVSGPWLDDGGVRRASIAWYRDPRVERRLRLVRRLAEMGPREIAHRASRIVAKRRGPAESALAGAATAPLPAAMAADPAAYLGARTVGRGFFDLDARPRLAALARERCPADVARTVREADAILTEGVELLGRRFRPAAPDFDWLADPTLGRVWPLAVMDDADAVRRVRADVKFVWEVNRHQFLVTLARAWAYTGDERYAAACVAMVRRWLAANPYGLGVNWASNLEVAVRSLSWVWAIQLLVGTPSLGADDLRAWLESLRAHRDHLARHLSTFTDPTNHLIGEAAALAVLAIWMPEWERSAELRTVALSTLEHEIRRQVWEDGVDHEQTMSYQRFVLDFYLQVIAIADRNGVPVAPVVRTRAAAMLDAVRVLVGAGGRAPRIGDSDDARGLPFFTEDPWSFSELLALGEAVLGGGQGGPHESALWLGARDRRDGAGVAQIAPKSVLLPSGYAVLTARPQSAEDRLVFDCGPLGYLPHASHGHADILSVLVDVGGEEVLVDPSSFAYYDEDGRRDRYRSTRAHNTVEVGGWDQADAFDPFKWLNLPHTTISAQRLGEGFDYVEAWHDGYERLRPAVRHRRGVLGLPGGWILIDWLEGHDRTGFVRWFHAAPGTRCEALARDAFRLWTPSGRAALVVRDLTGASDAPTRAASGLAPYSERYGREIPAPAVRFTDDAVLPAVRVTLLGVQHGERSGLRATAASWETDGALRIALNDGDGTAASLTVRSTGAGEARFVFERDAATGRVRYVAP